MSGNDVECDLEKTPKRTRVANLGAKGNLKGGQANGRTSEEKAGKGADPYFKQKQKVDKSEKGLESAEGAETGKGSCKVFLSKSGCRHGGKHAGHLTTWRRLQNTSAVSCVVLRVIKKACAHGHKVKVLGRVNGIPGESSETTTRPGRNFKSK